MNDLVTEIIHDPGRGVLLVKAVFCDTEKLKLRNILLRDRWRHVIYTGQLVYCGTEAE